VPEPRKVLIVFTWQNLLPHRGNDTKPWCDWPNEKKTHVYSRLARIINENKRIGVGVAVPKSLYDKVPDKIRDHYGYEHYTFAVRMCLMHILQWRVKSLISRPMKYVFDWEEPGTPKRKEISELVVRQNSGRL